MRATVRLVASVEPEIKTKLKEIALAKGVTMTDVLVSYIEKEHSKVKASNK